MVVIDVSEQSLILFDAFANLNKTKYLPVSLHNDHFHKWRFLEIGSPATKKNKMLTVCIARLKKTLPLLVFNHLNIFILKRKILTSSDCKRLYLKSISLVWTNLCLQYVRQLDRLSQFKQYIFTRIFVISPIYSYAEYLHNWFLSVNLNELKSIK